MSFGPSLVVNSILEGNMTQDDFQKKLDDLKKKGFTDAVICLTQTSIHRVPIYTIRVRPGVVIYRDINMSFGSQITMAYEEIIDLKGFKS